MADKEKKTKKKKKEEGGDAGGGEAPAPTRTSSKGSKSSSKKAKRSGSNVFSMFSQTQIAEFKEAFQLMDHDKDGVLSKADLRATFDMVGKLSNEKELDEMIHEAPGQLNFTQLLSLFALRMQDSGGSDDDEVVIAAFKTFDVDGTIDSETFRHALMNWGEKFTSKEVDDAFDAMEIDDEGKIDTAALIQLLTGKEEDEEETAAA